MSGSLAEAWLLAGLAVSPPSPSPVPTGGALVEPPVLIWSAPLPGTPPATATRSESAGPVVRGDWIFVGWSGDDALLVIDRRDGQVRYRLPMRAPVAAAATLTDEFVYAADTAGYTFAWRLDALDLATPAWTHFSGAPVVGSPSVDAGVVYVANVDETVYALDARTGDLRWRYAHKLELGRTASLELFGAPPPVPDPERGQVLCGFSDGFLVALGAQDGTPRWAAEVGEGAYPDLIAPPTVGPSGLLVGGYSEPLVSLAFDGRDVQWRLAVGSASPYTLDGGVVYHGGADGKLRRMDARTGEVAWTWDAGVGGTLGEPIVTPAGVLVAASEGTAYLVDAEKGALKWSFEPGMLLEGIAGPLVVEGDTAYVLSNAGVLYALRGRARPDAAVAEDWVTPW